MRRRVRLRSGGALVLAAALGCAPAPETVHSRAPAPAGATAAAVPRPSVPVGRLAPPPVRRSAEPAAARALGLMPLDATRVPAFAAAHPTYDGRGVIIAILDSGVDFAVAGLDTTPAGEPKLLDLRDFSREGEVVLEPFIAVGDTIAGGARPLIGGTALRSASPDGPWYRGALREQQFGAAPSADFDGDGDARDTLPLVVARDSAGWFLMADTDLDGSLAGELPVRDYAVERRGFSWARVGAEPMIGVAVNLGERNAAPVLDLYFDTSGHGTHVAGIAAGHRIYGAGGLDGVAPGAQLLGLKIANNARGGISTTGSMLAAIDYAIRYAAARDRPLVANLSFGVGNEREGAARIDAVLDSVLAANPGLVFTISAGNDGPGISTVGFPGSTRRALTVGATFPRAFLPREARGASADPIASFSGRGGELGKPDIVVPGVAYSTVPRWNAGNEISGGTSMAAPHAAGLAARIVSGLVQQGRIIRAADVRAAVVASARRPEGATWLDAGAGIADIVRAWDWLAGGRTAEVVEVHAGDDHPDARLVRGRRDTPIAPDYMFEVVRPDGAPRATYRLESSTAWLHAPASVTLGGGRSEIRVRYDAEALRLPGLHAGTVSAWPADSAAGPSFRLLNAVAVAHPAGAAVSREGDPLAPSSVSRVFFTADSARPFRAEVAAAAGTPAAAAYLHEPDGQPFRGGHGAPAGSGDGTALFHPDAADVAAGIYELAVVAPPQPGATARVAIRHAPVRATLAHSGSARIATQLTGLTSDTVTGSTLLLLVGAERRVQVTGGATREVSLPLEIPSWASSAVVDVRHPLSQWERFTDFGVSLLADGDVLGQNPMNYRFGRLVLDVGPDVAGPASLSLMAGFAAPDTGARWTVDVAVRFYAESPLALAADSAGSSAFVIAPGGTVRLEHPLPAMPWPLGEGFHPLAVLVADVDGVEWSYEAGLPEPATSETR